jgi:hypothetical protein
MQPHENTLGIHWEYTGNTLGIQPGNTTWEYNLGNTTWEYTGNTLGTSRNMGIHWEYIWEYIGNTLGIHWEYIGNTFGNTLGIQLGITNEQRQFWISNSSVIFVLFSCGV